MLSSLARRRHAVERLASAGIPALAAFFWAWAGQAALAGPQTGDALYREGLEMLARHKWAEAAVVLRSAFRKSPGSLQSSKVAVSLATSLVYSGRRSEAIELLSETAAKERGPRRASLIRRARVISRLFLTNQTFASYQEGVNLLLAKRTKGAKEKFEKALESEPDNVDILTRLGQSLVLLADFDSAAERLREAKRLNPYEPEIRLWLGRALHQRGELDSALTELDSAASELKSSEIAALWHADALWSKGHAESALEVLERDTAGQPLHVRALLALSRYRSKIGTPESANGADRPDRQTLWEVRKDLQVALSRIPAYLSAENANFEGELGLDVRSSPEELQEETKKLLQQVEDRLEAMNSGT